MLSCIQSVAVYSTSVLHVLQEKVSLKLQYWCKNTIHSVYIMYRYECILLLDSVFHHIVSVVRRLFYCCLSVLRRITFEMPLTPQTSQARDFLHSQRMKVLRCNAFIKCSVRNPWPFANREAESHTNRGGALFSRDVPLVEP